MTVLRPGEHADELISASLTGDLTEAEQAALSQHLAGCARCQQTLAAFREERRLISGVRHLQPPSDLGARVRAGIESGATGDLRWWQRRSTMVAVVGSLGAVAAGLLAVVLLSDLRAPVATATATPTLSAEVSVSTEPSPSVSVAATPSADSSPTPLPQPSIDPNPVGSLRYTIRDYQPVLEVATGQETTELNIDRDGMPIDAALSPDGSWLAFRLMGDATGLIDTYALRTADGMLVELAAQSLDSPFSRLAWSADSQLLAYTIGTLDPDLLASWDVWVFYAQADEPTTRQLTNNGASFAADFPLPATDDVNLLWVSVAGDDPVTYGIGLRSAPVAAPLDPVAMVLPDQTHDGAFLPVRAPGEGSPAVVWHGQMQADDMGWRFARGGMLYLAQPGQEGTFAELGTEDQQIFDTLAMPPGGEAFGSARFAWAPDGDGLAVWDAQWVGVPQEEGFPDETRVYFGHPTSGTMIGARQALDLADTGGGRVVQVSLAGGPYLALTVLTEPGAEGGDFGPTAELRLVTRNLGDVPDHVQTLARDKVWYGPAFYPAVLGHQGE